MSAVVEERTPTSMVERMTLILDTFNGRSAPLTLEDIARSTQLPRSTAHRILDQLVRLSWLEHSGFGYSLGRRSRHVGGKENGYGDLRAAASPFLHELMLRTGLTVHLAVRDEDQVIYLDKLGGQPATTVPSRVGGHAPVACTALGKAMLAGLPAEEVDALVGDRIDQRTPRSITDLAALHQELNGVRATGLAFERGECFDRIACVAAAVLGPEGPVAAVSIVGRCDSHLERVAPLVLDVARRISSELFPDLPRHRRRRCRPRHAKVHGVAC